MWLVTGHFNTGERPLFLPLPVSSGSASHPEPSAPDRRVPKSTSNQADKSGRHVVNNGCGARASPSSLCPCPWLHQRLPQARRPLSLLIGPLQPSSSSVSWAWALLVHLQQTCHYSKSARMQPDLLLRDEYTHVAEVGLLHSCMHAQQLGVSTRARLLQPFSLNRIWAWALHCHLYRLL